MAFYKCDKKQNSGTGFKVDDVSNFTAVADSSDAKVTLSWTDPDDFEIEGTVQAKWAGTVIVRKAYSEPKSTGDGTIVLNSTVKNQYSVNGFEDENVYLSTTYYYRAFPYTTDGVTTVGTSVSVETAAAQIYGAEWDGTASSSWTRTDKAAEFTDPVPARNNGNGSSPFDNIQPWAGMQRVEDAEAGTLVSIPKFYYKWTRNGSKMKLQISMTQYDGFLVSPAHADRGDGKGERDVVYVGAYHCATSTHKSTTGVLPQVSETRATFRTAIHNLGTTIWQWDFAMYWTIAMLYLVEYANWNTQNTIGMGGSDNGRIENNGLTDAMTYHTGTNATYEDDLWLNKHGHVRYRYIEDLWANVYEWVDGIYTSSTAVYCTKNPSNFADGSGGSLIFSLPGGIETDVGAGSIKSWATSSTSGFEFALFPSVADGYSDSDYAAYVGDAYYVNQGNQVMRTGHNYGIGVANKIAGDFGGLFFYGFDRNGTLTPDEQHGSRLMKLP